MRVFLGGTVNGSKWRNQFKQELIIDYFDPVVEDWNDAAYERELSERRNCDYLLYIITPKLTGYYAIAEVTDDSYQRPDRTLFCYLTQDEEAHFTKEETHELDRLGALVQSNGAKWFKNTEEVIAFLKASNPKIELSADLRYDAFISYGRGQSQHFADQLTNWLSDMKYEVFNDAGEIPVIIDNEELIYANILKSDNFIYLISPNAVRSEYCKKELDFAIKYKKRIIPVLHMDLGTELEKLDDLVANKPVIQFEGGEDGFRKVVFEVKRIIEKDKTYVQLHSRLLYKGRHWEANGRLQGELLFGKELKMALAWLGNNSEYVVPLQVHNDYITASRKLPLIMLPLLWLESKTRSFTHLKLFDKVTFIIALGNPLALANQLKLLLKPTDDLVYQSVSVPMWICFLIIQVTLTFVGIKKKDLGLFISMLLSLLISSAVITLVLWRR